MPRFRSTAIIPHRAPLSNAPRRALRVHGRGAGFDHQLRHQVPPGGGGGGGVAQRAAPKVGASGDGVVARRGFEPRNRCPTEACCCRRPSSWRGWVFPAYSTSTPTLCAREGVRRPFRDAFPTRPTDIGGVIWPTTRRSTRMARVDDKGVDCPNLEPRTRWYRTLGDKLESTQYCCVAAGKPNSGACNPGGPYDDDFWEACRGCDDNRFLESFGQ
jgi:hypothetical protein